MGSKAKIIWFNVGGTRYDVARSLLEAHPETMLTRMASAQWHDNPDTEIFIKRDGGRFKYCLDYLRDGKIHLPITMNKEAVLKDLEYYNVEVKNENVVEYGRQEKMGVCTSIIFQKFSQMKNEFIAVDEEFEKFELRRAWLNLSMELFCHITRLTLYTDLTRSNFRGSYSPAPYNAPRYEIDRMIFIKSSSQDNDNEGDFDIAQMWSTCNRCSDKRFGKSCFRRLGLNLISISRTKIILELLEA